jgi:hypothetical protein
MAHGSAAEDASSHSTALLPETLSEFVFERRRFGRAKLNCRMGSVADRVAAGLSATSWVHVYCLLRLQLVLQ